MTASVIIITKNQKEFLHQTIPTLLSQKFSGSFEIIVVDSGSTDGAVEYVKTFPVKRFDTLHVSSVELLSITIIST